MNNTEENLIWKRILEFVISERWEYSFPLTVESRLVEDLQIYGDDAEEFMEKFFQEFQVEGENFDYHKYFPDEDIISYLWNYKILKRSLKIPLTLGDLYSSVRAGKFADAKG